MIQTNLVHGTEPHLADQRNSGFDRMEIKRPYLSILSQEISEETYCVAALSFKESLDAEFPA